MADKPSWKFGDPIPTGDDEEEEEKKEELDVAALVEQERVHYAWRDPLQIVQQLLLRPRLQERWLAPPDLQRVSWVANMPHAYFHHDFLWAFTTKEPELFLVYSTNFVKAADGAPTLAPLPGVVTGHRPGSVLWVHAVDADKVEHRGTGAEVPFDESPATFDFWTLCERSLRSARRQPLRPNATALVVRWRSEGHLHRDPTGYQVLPQAPASMFDGATSMVMWIRRPGQPDVCNSAFFNRPGCAPCSAQTVSWLHSGMMVWGCPGHRRFPGRTTARGTRRRARTQSSST